MKRVHCILMNRDLDQDMYKIFSFSVKTGNA